MFKIKFHNIAVLLFALSVMLWGIAFNLQDSEKAHALSIKIIQDNSTGGDCSSIGTWNNYTKTCTLTGDLTIPSIGNNTGIEIVSSNVTLDCDGHSITSTGGISGSVGVFVSSQTNVTIKNCTISSFFTSPIIFIGGSNNSVINNTVTGGAIGIYFSGSDNNYIVGNSSELAGAIGGLNLFSSDGNEVYGNKFITSGSNGILINGTASSSNIIVGNTMDSNDNYGIDVSGSASNNIIEGNTIRINGTGIRFSNSGGSGNTLNSNIITGNATTDIDGDSSVSGDNNTCAINNNWDDIDETIGSPWECTWTAPLSSLSCNDAPSQSVLLTSDITAGCSANGIQVFFDDILIDCDRHTISGSGLQSGILSNSGRSNVTIANCTISNFGTEIDLGATNSNINIISNTVADGAGIRIQGTTILVAGNTLSSNTEAINVQASSSNILFNSLTNASNSGIAVTGNSNTIYGNEIANAQIGIVTISDSNTIAKNIVDHDGVTASTTGIYLFSAALNNIITSNVVTDHTTAGISFSSDSTGNQLGGTNAFEGNIVIGNTTDIIDLDSNDGASTDDNNTCDVVSGWSDFGEINACTFSSINAPPVFTTGPSEKWFNSLADTWFAQVSPISNGLKSVAFVDNNTGWAVSSNNEIINTTDGGDTWVNSSIPGQFKDLFCLDSNTCWAVGNSGLIKKTSDTSSSWPSSNTTNTINSIYFSDSNNGWAVGTGAGTGVLSTSNIRTTSDGGATWTAQTSGTANTLFRVFFADSQKGWAVGAGGAILGTTNGGTTWTTQTSGTADQLMGLYVDADAPCQSSASNCEVWATGGNGAIRYTSDGGSNWSGQTSGTSGTLIDTHFVDANIGWAVGAVGTILSTTDGGTNWIDESTGSLTLWGIHAFDENNIWAVGDGSTILKSGYQVNSSSVNPTHAGSDVVFTATASDPDSDDYYLAICKTDAITAVNNGAPTCPGSSWAISFATTSGTPVTTASYLTSESDAFQNDWYAFICDHNASSTCTSSVFGDFYVNHRPFFLNNFSVTDTSGGATEPGDQLKFNFEVNDNDGDDVTAVVCDTTYNDVTKTCDNEELCRTTISGGSQWYNQRSALYQLNDIDCFDDNTCWTAGFGGTILNTVDGGANWNTQVSGTSNALYGISFADSSSGWTVGDNGTILVTTNDGTTWSAQTSGTTSRLKDISCIDSSTCWAVGYTDANPPFNGDGVILKTTNGGSSWGTQASNTDSSIDQVYFVDSNNGWAVGPWGGVGGNAGNIRATTDGGSTWTAQVSGTAAQLRGLYFLNSTTGWTVGESGKILKTTDGGVNWITQTSGVSVNLFGVYFVNDNEGFVGGSGGLILKTVDGGVTWSALNSGVDKTLSSIYFTDSDVGWIVGGSETILKTTTGGVLTGSCTETDSDPSDSDTNPVYIGIPEATGSKPYTVHAFDENSFPDDGTYENQSFEVVSSGGSSRAPICNQVSTQITNLNATLGQQDDDTTIQLTWNASNGDSGERFLVYRSTDGSTNPDNMRGVGTYYDTTNPENTTHQDVFDQDIDYGETYTYIVEARNDCSGSTSDSVSIYLPTRLAEGTTVNLNLTLKVKVKDVRESLLLERIKQILIDYQNQINDKTDIEQAFISKLVERNLINTIDPNTLTSYSQIADNQELKEAILEIPNIETLIKGHSGDLTLEIWEQGNRAGYAYDLQQITTNIFGEARLNLPNFTTGTYDFAIKHTDALREFLSYQGIFTSSVNLDFSNASLRFGDFNNDSVIDLLDLQVLSFGINQNPDQFDINEDGVFDLRDLMEILTNWGE